MPVVVGISGVKRNACAAVCIDGEIRAVCEQERLMRVRGAGLTPREPPYEAVEQVLALADRTSADVSAIATAERHVPVPDGTAAVRLDHHHAHAATAFLTSPHPRAAVLVCDRDVQREVSVWIGEHGYLRDQHWEWSGPGFATVYSACAALFDFPAARREHRMEAAAHLGTGRRADELQTLFRYDGGLRLNPAWRRIVGEMIQRDAADGAPPHADVASALQRRIGELLLALVADIAAAIDCDTLCLGGGLFFNTYFTTLIRRSGLFRHVFVPVNPGNAGVAVGAALVLSGGRSAALTPFLGPEYDREMIKHTLDGCKLSYEFDTENAAIDAAVEALARGQLVGWFQGRMEWGHRALGHRSILADPRSEYVLDNLNCFLRKRERSRAFGISILEEAAGQWLCGPADSPFMAFESTPRDDRLRHVIPAGAASIRVQTVSPGAGAFRTLHERMAQATGSAALVNTSLSGFHEPIACSPRDAVRIFFGTGLDLLVIGRFILRK
jgi:carbamoyltransferase